jgi:hypothetical protein
MQVPACPLDMLRYFRTDWRCSSPKTTGQPSKSKSQYYRRRFRPEIGYRLLLKSQPHGGRLQNTQTCMDQWCNILRTLSQFGMRAWKCQTCDLRRRVGQKFQRLGRSTGITLHPLAILTKILQLDRRSRLELLEGN